MQGRDVKSDKDWSRVRCSRDRTVLAFTILAMMALSCGSKQESSGAAESSPKVTLGMTPLTGEVFVSGKTLVDPMPEEPRDTHFRLHLTGESARTLLTT